MATAVEPFIPDTFAALRDAVAEWFPPGRPAGQYELVGALRAATAGVEGELWGHAAAADAAAWVNADSHTPPGRCERPCGTPTAARSTPGLALSTSSGSLS
ncbi:hypothetical protein [Streptomyces sp. CMB-StM0423]|uniref:hypothetical protein n=1 Tax=Streptomyces sp. CMB-StM0423 TaxID=2059884 RepID=UPI00131ADF11|nr:hypothetical protein [Streptomyces sp. CMB-StM0423]